MVGKCVWFDVKKGFGFIRSDEHRQDIFVHYSKIIAEPGEFRLIEEGEEVEFEMFMADRGDGISKPQAKNVKRTGRIHAASEKSERRYIAKPKASPSQE